MEYHWIQYTHSPNLIIMFQRLGHGSASVSQYPLRSAGRYYYALRLPGSHNGRRGAAAMPTLSRRQCDRLVNGSLGLCAPARSVSGTCGLCRCGEWHLPADSRSITAFHHGSIRRRCLTFQNKAVKNFLNACVRRARLFSRFYESQPQRTLADQAGGTPMPSSRLPQQQHQPAASVLHARNHWKKG